MPIMTAGLAAIPVENSSSGSTLNNIAQRVSGALGLAIMNSIASTQQNQLMADRSALVPSTSSLPQVQQAVSEGTTALYAIYQQLLIKVTAGAYSDVFYVTAIVTASGVVLGLFMRQPQPAPPETRAESPTAQADAAPNPTASDHKSEKALEGSESVESATLSATTSRTGGTG
jgi:hypothetical protein